MSDIPASCLNLNDDSRIDICVNKPKRKVFITISGAITFDTYIDLTNVITTERANGVNTIAITLMSRGGNVSAGFAIYDMLKMFSICDDTDISITVNGCASSAAIPIVMAIPIKRRFIMAGSTMLFHTSYLTIPNDKPVSDGDAIIKMYNAKMTDICKNHFKQDEDFYAGMFADGEDHPLDSDALVNLGIFLQENVL